VVAEGHLIKRRRIFLKKTRDRLVRVHTQHDSVRHATRDPGDVRDALAAPEADLGRRQIDAVAAELRDPDIKRQARPKTRLLEYQRDRATGQARARGTGLEPRALFE